MVKLLAGGNPQIPKGDGEKVVQTYIEACPDWKQDVVRHLDQIITEAAPDVEKAVRWNSPFYGSPDGGWFLSLHCFTKYVKVTFFDGSALDPPPPFAGKDPKVRWYHVFEDRGMDEGQVRDWVRQAAALPGWGGVSSE